MSLVPSSRRQQLSGQLHNLVRGAQVVHGAVQAYNAGERTINAVQRAVENFGEAVNKGRRYWNDMERSGSGSGAKRARHGRKIDARTGGFLYIKPGELKFYDNVYAHAAVQPDFIDCQHLTEGMVAPTQGAGPSNRVGRKIFLKSLELDFQAEWVGLNLDVSASDLQMRHLEAFRLLIVLDKQWNGASGSTKQDLDLIMSELGTDGNAVAAINSFPNLENSQRFKILTDKMIAPPDSSVGVIGSVNGVSKYVYPRVDKTFVWKHTWKRPLPINFKSSTASSGQRGSSADITDNNILVYCIRRHHAANTTSPNVNTAGITVRITSRAQYTD